MSVLHYVLLLTVVTATSGEPSFFDLTLTSFTLSNLWKKTFSTTTTTITETETETSVVASQVTRFCATTSAVTGQCRRRRAAKAAALDDILHDDVSQLIPSPVRVVEETSVSSGARLSAPVQLSSSLRDSPTDHDYQNIYQDSYQVEGRGWSYSKYFLTTVTTTTSSTTTTTSTLSVTVATRTYTIIFCTPSTYSLLSC